MLTSKKAAGYANGFASSSAGTESVAVPIVTPTSSTTYSSFSGNAFNSYGTTHVNGFGSSTS
jgi:hypothetical protein